MRLRKRTWTSLASFALAAGAVVYLLRFTPLVSQQVSRRFTENLLQQHGYRLDLDAVRGTPWGDLVFYGPRLTPVRDSTGVVGTAEELRLRLHPLHVLRGRFVVEKLTLVRPRVLLSASKLAPPPGTEPAELVHSVFPRLSIDHFEIVDGTVERHTPHGIVGVQHINAKLLVRSRPKQVRVRLDGLSASVPSESLLVQEGAGNFVWRADTLHVENAHLRTPGSLVEVQGRVIPSRGRGMLEGNVSPLDLRELSTLAGRPLPGTIQGPLQVRWQGHELQLAGTFSGHYDAYRFDQVAADLAWSPNLLRVRHAAGRVNDSPLDLQLEARGEALSGKLQLGGVDLRKLLPERTAQLPENELQGEIRFLRRATRDTLRLEFALHSSRVHGVALDHLSGRAGWLGDHLRVEEGRVDSPLGMARFAGSLHGDAVQAQFDLQTSDAGAVLRTAGVRGVEGALHAQGTLSGTRQNLQLQADATFDRLAYSGITARRGELLLSGDHLGPQPSLALDLRADSVQARGRLARAVSADLRYADGTLQVRRSQASLGDTLLAAVGTVRRQSMDWSGNPAPTTVVALETALLQLGDQEVRVEEPATFWLRHGAARVDSLRLVTRGGSLRLDGSVDRDSRQVSLRAQAQGFDLGFVRQFVRLRQDLAGSASGWIEAHGSLDRTRFDGQLDAWAGRWNNLPFDTLQVAMQSDADAIDFPKVHLATPHGHVDGQLRIAYLPALGRWIEGRTGLRSKSEIEAAEVSGALRLAELDLRQIWLARAGSGPPPRWMARASCELQIAGTVGQPRFETQGQVFDLRYGTSQIGALRFKARYDGERLALQEAELSNSGQVMHISGELPVQLHLADGKAQLQRDQPLVAHMTLPRSSFALLQRSLPIFEPPPAPLSPGEIEAQLDVAGTLATPQMHGTVNVYGAAFMIRGLEEVYTSVDAHGEFDGATLRFSEMHGRSGEKGTLRGQGSVSFEPWRLRKFHLVLDADQAPFGSIPNVSGIVSGRLTIDDAPSGGKVPIPNIKGTFRVLQAEITQEFTTNAEEQELIESTDLPDWLVDVTLEAPGNVWIHNSQADAELQGNVRIVRNSAGLDFKGQAQIKRGNYSYYLERFRITPGGTLEFSRYGFDPELDIQGESGRPGNRVYVHLTGHLKEPQVTFTSDQPGETAGEIQERLLAFTGGKGGNVTTQRVNTAAATWAKGIVNDLRYLPYFSIDPNDSTSSSGYIFGYNVSAGRALSDRLFLIYTQGVGTIDLRQKVAVELDINRRLLLESSYARGHLSGTDTEVQDAYDLLLKYRREY